MSDIIFYRCESCGNTYEGGTRVCCEQPMTKLKPNTTDGPIEKHIPVIVKENGTIEVAVGSTLHPMLPEHRIEWIVMDNGKRTEIVYLKPSMEPRAEFTEFEPCTIYGYCNVHGLWKTDFSTI